MPMSETLCTIMYTWDSIMIYFDLFQKQVSSTLKWCILYQTKILNRPDQNQDGIIGNFLHWFTCQHLYSNLKRKGEKKKKSKRHSCVTSQNTVIMPVSFISMFRSIHKCSIQLKIHCCWISQMSNLHQAGQSPKTFRCSVSLMTRIF